MAKDAELSITYCVECGYLPDAIIMLDKLMKQFQTRLREARLITGGNGQFEVAVNGAPVFSKLETGRFPSIQELRESIRPIVYAASGAGAGED